MKKKPLRRQIPGRALPQAPHQRPVAAGGCKRLGQPSDVESSMVDGRFVMRNNKVLTLDEPALIAEADKVGQRVWKRVVEAGGPIPIPGRSRRR